MYLGHYAVAFAAKKAAPRTSLGTLILASQLIDIIWPALVLTGIEKVSVDPGNTAFTPLDFTSYPFTHSLFMVIVWASLLSWTYGRFSRYRAGAVTIWFLVVSHWILDLITHRPDLPLLPGGSARVGLGLWNSITWTLILELSMFLAGVAVYARVTRKRGRLGGYVLWAMVIFLLTTYAANVMGPPPPSGKMVAISTLLLWLLVPWGYWIDWLRRPVRLRL